MPVLTRSHWIVIGILVLLFVLYWMVFGTGALKYLVA